MSSKYFKHRNGYGLLTINEDVISFILDEAMHPCNKDIFYIMDPHFIPYDHLYAPMQEFDFDASFWISFITRIARTIDSGEIRILTCKKIDTDLFYQSEGEYSFCIQHPDNADVVIIFAHYPRSQSRPSAPNRLHDRWILKKEFTDNALSGIHIGPSLHNIDDKDITITEIINPALNEMYERYNFIWKVATR